MEWHYFTVIDEFTGLSCSFRWREAICDYCGVDYRFQLYCGLCGKYALSWILLIWIVVLSTAVILISGIFIGIFMYFKVL